MPSRSGTLLAQKFSAILLRDLTVAEVIALEELALNRFTNTLLKFIDGLTKKPLKHSFEGIYGAASGGVIRAADRGARKVQLTGKLLGTYQKCDLYKAGMSDNEMQAVIELSDKFTPAEHDRGIMLARSRGISSVRYVLGICEGNKDKPTERPKKKIVPFDNTVLRPDSKAVATAWERSLDLAADKLRENEAQRAADAATRDR